MIDYNNFSPLLTIIIKLFKQFYKIIIKIKMFLISPLEQFQILPLIPIRFGNLDISMKILIKYKKFKNIK